MLWHGERIDPPDVAWQVFPHRQAMGKVKWMAQGVLAGTKVYVKRGLFAPRQAAADTLKAWFGLPSMGTVWWADGTAEPYVAMRWRPVIGSFKDHPEWAMEPRMAEDLARLLVFDLAIANRDRNRSNVLRLPINRILPVDEPWAFQYDKPWALRVPAPLVHYGLLMLPNVLDPIRQTLGRHRAELRAIADRTAVADAAWVGDRLEANLEELDLRRWMQPAHVLDRPIGAP